MAEVTGSTPDYYQRHVILTFSASISRHDEVHIEKSASYYWCINICLILSHSLIFIYLFQVRLAKWTKPNLHLTNLTIISNRLCTTSSHFSAMHQQMHIAKTTIHKQYKHPRQHTTPQAHIYTHTHTHILTTNWVDCMNLVGFLSS